jgi:hypothetical protein
MMPTDVNALLWLIVTVLSGVVVTLALAFVKQSIVSGKTYRQALKTADTALEIADTQASTLEQLSRYVNEDSDRDGRR